MQSESKDEKLEILEGTITDFHWDRGTVNLLEQIQKKSKGKNAAAGVAAAAAGMYGVVASSAMLVMYDGEDVENFVCRIGEKIVCGQFSGADHLKDGDVVKAVVTQQGDLYRAEAILRYSDEVLWLPVGSYLGTNADLRGQMRMAWRLGIFAFIVYLVICFLLSAPKGMYLLGFVMPFLGFPVGLWVHSDMRPIALRAEKIFQALGFPYPEDMDMGKGMYLTHNSNIDSNLSSNMLSMFYYQKAIEFEKQRRIRKKLPLQDSTSSS